MDETRTWHVGLTRLVPEVPGGRWLCAAALFGILMGAFGAAGLLSDDLPRTLAGNRAGAVFFAVIIAYIVPVFHYISQRTAEALASLQADLGLDAAGAAALAASVYRKPRQWFGWVLGIGCGSAVLHNLLLARGETSLADAFGNAGWWTMVAGTALVWIVMTLVIAALMDNAFLLNRLARRVNIHLLNPERTRPFGRVAVLSTLSIIGAQAAFPIMIFDGNVNPVAFAPGLAATTVPMLVLALMPVWPLHVRLRAERSRLLADVNRRIVELDAEGGPAATAELLPLLAWRRELLAISEWPLDARSLGRLAFYLVIPPLTWVGAALIEHLVESLL